MQHNSKRLDLWFSAGLIVGLIISTSLVIIILQPQITTKLGFVL